MKLALLVLSVPLLMQAQLYPPDPCANNCGTWTGDCTSCHLSQGKGIWFADFTYICPDCPPNTGKVLPQVPFRSKPTDSVVAFLEQFTVKQDPKLLRLMAMTPERHVALMERAIRLKLDGPFLGPCHKSFKVGTLALLPNEIKATKLRVVWAAK